MFDIGIQELVIVFLVALLVFGPKRLPELGRTLGKFMFEIRKGLTDAKSQMESEFREIEKGSAEQAEQHDGEALPHGGSTRTSGDSGEEEKNA